MPLIDDPISLSPPRSEHQSRDGQFRFSSTGRSFICSRSALPGFWSAKLRTRSVRLSGDGLEEWGTERERRTLMTSTFETRR